MTHDERDSFGALLRLLRRTAGLTQEELAERAEISVRQLGYLEMGAHHPRPGTARRLADALGLPQPERTLFVTASEGRNLRHCRLPAREDLPVAPAEVGALRPTSEESKYQDYLEEVGTFPRSCLPVESTPFIGRVRELATARELLERDDVRLVTLTGPAGTGKTRLAVQLARSLLDGFTEGVIFVNLSPVAHPAHVLHAIAAELRLGEEEGRTLRDTLLAHLAARDVLLILDNFEHVLSAAPLVAEILGRSRRLKVLTTSRALLRLAAERPYDVPPLAVPSQDVFRSTDALLRYDSVALYAERASAARSTFALTDGNAHTVVQICRRLDGLPLAISLAAARLRVIPPEALLKRLDNSLSLLTRGPHDVPKRQQTLRAAIEWSFNLLSDKERRLITRLSVFSGGFTVEAAESVCDRNDDFDSVLLDGIHALVDQSLLQIHEGTDGRWRFMMLRTIQEYATEQLEMRGEAELFRERHAVYYLDVLEETVSRPTAAVSSEWAERLEAEVDNLRAALQWSLNHGADDVLRLADCLHAYWTRLRAFTEGRRWLELALKQSTADRSLRARGLQVAALLAGALGDCNEAADLCRESLAHYREVGDTTREADTLRYLGWLAMVQGRHSDARTFHEASLAVAREIGNQAAVAAALHGLATVVVNNQGDLTDATSLLEKSLALFQEVRDEPATAPVLNLLGFVDLEQGNYDRATRYLERALDVEDEGVQLTLPVIGLAIVAGNRGQFERGAALFETALEVAARNGDKRVMAMALLKLADLLASQGQLEAAATRYRRSLCLWRDVGNGGMIAIALEGLAALQLEDGDPGQSVTLLAAAADLRTRFRVARHMDDPKRRKETLDRARRQCDSASWDSAWNRGSAMTADGAVSYATDGVDASTEIASRAKLPT